MQVLVRDNCVQAIGEKIEYGKYEGENFEKWRVSTGESVYYCIADDCEVINNVTIPEDYVGGKYFFENGEFVVNEDWKPYVSPEERISELEGTVEILQEENIASSEIEAELLYELSLLQLGFTE